jgi:DGQHR domain-containing protein
MSTPEHSVLKRRALRIEQHPDHPVYLFSLTADELLAISEVSRVSRDETGKLIGYQRPEVRQHVRNIVDYLDAGDVVFPNSIILALSSSVVFREVRGPKVDAGRSVVGTLEIPLPRKGAPKPAWIVDGQQRVLALSKAKNRELVVPVNGFVADDVEVQRDQFVRVNSARPLPRGLVTELLPEISSSLPASLSVRKAPSALCDLLNKHPDSPFLGLIRRPSTKGEDAIITDTALVKALEESLSTANGCLFPYRNVATNETDYNAVVQVLILYWRAVRDTWPEAWGKPPSKSRLTHSAGIRAMGRLMDRVMGGINPSDPKASARVQVELEKLKPYCNWTNGHWRGLASEPVAWDAIESTSTDIKALTNFLIRTYTSVRWGER